MNTKLSNNSTPDEPLVDLVEALENIDENSPSAELNASTISDNNGRRIELDKSKLQGRPPVQGNFSTDTKFVKVKSSSTQPKES